MLDGAYMRHVADAGAHQHNNYLFSHIKYMDQKKLKKKIQDIIEEVDYPTGKKSYKGMKKGFTRKYTGFRK